VKWKRTPGSTAARFVGTHRDEPNPKRRWWYWKAQSKWGRSEIAELYAHPRNRGTSFVSLRLGLGAQSTTVVVVRRSTPTPHTHPHEHELPPPPVPRRRTVLTSPELRTGRPSARRPAAPWAARSACRQRRRYIHHGQQRRTVNTDMIFWSINPR
jgi:hypothetical protein